MAEGRGMQGFHPCPVSLCVSLLYMVERWKTLCNRDGCPWRGEHGVTMRRPRFVAWAMPSCPAVLSRRILDAASSAYFILFFLYNRFLFIVFNQFSSIFSRKFTLELIVFKQPYSRVNLWNRPNQDRTII